MKRWIQISMLSILIVCVANIGYLNHKVVDFRRDIHYTQAQTTFHLNSLYNHLKEKDDCLYDQIAKLRNSSTIPQVVEEVIKSVVHIEVRGKVQNPYSGKMVDSGYYGTGIIYDTEGHILTAGHVVENMKLFQDSVMIVKCYKGKEFKVLNTIFLKMDDPNQPDLGLIKIDTEGIELTPVILGERNLSIGETVISIGHPKQLTFSVTAGIVSRLGNAPCYPNGFYLQTDAAINPGNSGGPLFGLDGKVYGISIFVLRMDGAEEVVLEGLNFATPVSVVNENIQKLIEELECGAYNE